MWFYNYNVIKLCKKNGFAPSVTAALDAVLTGASKTQRKSESFKNIHEIMNIFESMQMTQRSWEAFEILNMHIKAW